MDVFGYYCNWIFVSSESLSVSWIWNRYGDRNDMKRIWRLWIWNGYEYGCGYGINMGIEWKWIWKKHG